MLKKMMIIGVTAMTFGICGAALADEVETQGTLYEDYYEILVPNIYSSTATQSKAQGGSAGSIQSDTVGGTYFIDARMAKTTGSQGALVTNIGDNETVSLPATADMDPGSNIYMKLLSDAPVDVEVFGAWKSN